MYKYDLPRQIKSVLLLLHEWYVILCKNYGGIAQPNKLRAARKFKQLKKKEFALGARKGPAYSQTTRWLADK